MVGVSCSDQQCPYDEISCPPVDRIVPLMEKEVSVISLNELPIPTLATVLSICLTITEISFLPSLVFIVNFSL